MEAFSSYADDQKNHHPVGNFFGDQVYFQVGEMSNASSSSCYNYSSDIELIPTPKASSENKRKQSTDHGSNCFSNTGKFTSKGGKGFSRGRKQKKSMNSELKAKDKEMKAKSDEEPPSGYIHVRARRGQATDSHSLAERVRRERISERMKKLQSLVPGCDKVTGKALVLDEIINYVQSLHNQVEFLSMKLASENPVIYDFAADNYAELMIQTQEVFGSMSQPMPSAIQQTPPPTFGGTPDNSIAFSLQGHGPTNFSQNGGSFICQAEFHNMCSFH